MNITAIAMRIVCNGWHLAGIRQQLREGESDASQRPQAA